MMKVKVTRKRDSQNFTGVMSLTMTKKGRFFPHVYVDIKFGIGASTHYISKNQDIGWEIDPDQTPSIGMDFCKKIEIYLQTSGETPT